MYCVNTYVPNHMHLQVTCVYTRVLACMDVCEDICETFSFTATCAATLWLQGLCGVFGVLVGRSLPSRLTWRLWCHCKEVAKKNLTKKEVMNGAKKAKGTPNKLNIKDKKLKKKPKALAYSRISTRTNKDKAGMKRQFSACRAIAQTRGYKLVDSIDEVISGRLSASPSLVETRLTYPTTRSQNSIVA